MKRQKLRLSNDVHGTEVVVSVRVIGNGFYLLNKSQSQKVRRTLCPDWKWCNRYGRGCYSSVISTCGSDVGFAMNMFTDDNGNVIIYRCGSL